jgi:FkbM family methyltransferase
MVSQTPARLREVYRWFFALWVRVKLWSRDVYLLYVKRDGHYRGVKRWIAASGDRTLLLEHPLTAESTVLDVGGFRGDWTAAILARADASIHVVEPVPTFAAAIRARFAANPRVVCHELALSDRGGTAQISLSDNASSLFRGQGTRQQIALKDVRDFFQEQGLSDVALIKINIEGAEYPLLERMAETDLLRRCNTILVQFHGFVPDAAVRRERIRQTLSETHALLFDYPFVWEGWRRRTED